MRERAPTKSPGRPIAFLPSCALFVLVAGGLAGSESAAAQGTAPFVFSSLWQFPLQSQEGEQLIHLAGTWIHESFESAVFGAEVDSVGGQRGFWSASAQGTSRVVRTFDPLPGLPAGVTSLDTNGAGRFVGNGDFWFYGSGGILGGIWQRSNSGTVSFLTGVGQPIPGGAGSFSSVSLTRVARDGTPYLSGRLDSAPNQNLLWRVQGGTFQSVTQGGQVVAGASSPVSSTNLLRVTPDGRAFVSVLTTASSNASSVAVIEPGAVLATNGVISALNGYSLQHVSPQGAMLLTKGTTFGNSQSIWSRTVGGQMTEVIRPGAAVAGVPGWTVADMFVQPAPQPISVADDGRGLVTAVMGPAGDRRSTLAITSATSVVPVLRDGVPLGSGVLALATGGVSATDFNDRGQVAMQVFSRVGSTLWPSVVAWDPELGLVNVAAYGDQLLIDGSLRTITAAELVLPMSDQTAHLRGGLSNAGVLALKINFPSGQPMIISTTIPTPSSGVLLLGAAAVFHRRRRPACREAVSVS